MQGFLPSKISWFKIAANVADELVKFDAILSLCSLSYNTPMYNWFIWGHFQPQKKMEKVGKNIHQKHEK